MTDVTPMRSANRPSSERALQRLHASRSELVERITQVLPADGRAEPLPGLCLLARGLTNGAIAEQLSLSIKTVRNRVSDIFSKLHVQGRAEAIIKARDAGLQ